MVIGVPAYAKALTRSLKRRGRVDPRAPVVLPTLERAAPPAVQDEGRLARFRALTGYPDDGRLPLTWPQAAAFPLHFALMLDERFPLPLVGTVHVRTSVRSWSGRGWRRCSGARRGPHGAQPRGVVHRSTADCRPPSIGRRSTGSAP